MNTGATLGMLWLPLTLIVTIAVAELVNVATYRVPVGGVRDQLRSARFVRRYDRALRRRGIGRRERVRLVSELRANTAAAAADVGVHSALARIGTPRELADDVVTGRSLPTWRRGAVAGAVTFVALQIVVVIAFQAWSSAAEQAGVAQLSGGTSVLPGIDFTYARSPASGGYDSSDGWHWPFLIPLAVAAIWARPWRLVSDRAQRPTTS